MNQFVCPAPMATRDAFVARHASGGRLGGMCAGCSSYRRRAPGGAQ